MYPRKLAFSGKTVEYVNGFLFKCSLLKMLHNSVEETKLALVQYLEDVALNFYLERLTEGDDLLEEGKDYNTVNRIMLSKYSKQKTESKIIQEAVDLRYSESYIQNFFRKV